MFIMCELFVVVMRVLCMVVVCLPASSVFCLLNQFVVVASLLVAADWFVRYFDHFFSLSVVLSSLYLHFSFSWNCGVDVDFFFLSPRRCHVFFSSV